jgi:RNA polymerase-binding protein DksA
MAERAVGNKGDTAAATPGGKTATRGAHKTVTAAKTTASPRKSEPAQKSASAEAAVAAKTKPGSVAKKSAAPGKSTPVQAPPRGAKSSETVAAEGATMAKAAESKTAAKPVAKKGTRSAAETEKIRLALTARRDELQEEYSSTVAELAELQRDRLTDSAGDDQADTGTKTFEREQEITLANAILDRITQVERALERLDEGSYGWCERCGNPIPVERLAAFPSATLCVSCKQLEERR